MYAKIQKGKSQSYMLIHSDAQITINPRVAVFDELWDYMCQQQASSGKCGDDSNSANQSADVLHKLGVGLAQPFIILYETDRVFWYGSPERPEFKGIDLSIAHVNIDGVSYLTEGNVYILNDKGQTIQKI
jgi:hypothetical protein